MQIFKRFLRQFLAHQFSPLFLLILISAAILIRFDRPLIRGDGVAYLAWVDTFALDQDINLNNQFDRFRPVNTYQIAWNFNTERWTIIFPFGAAILQSPFYLLGDLFLQNGWANANPDYFHQMQGVELPYSLWIMFGTNLMTLVTLALSWDIGRFYTNGWMSAIITFLAFLSTPLLFYSTIEPLNSHSSGAFTFTCFFWLLHKREKLRTPGAILMGIMAGLTILTRWQLLVAVFPGYMLLIAENRWRLLIVAGMAAAVTLLPLPIIWNEMFGKPFVIPYNENTGTSFLQAENQFFNVLYYTLITSPVTLFIFPGVIILFRSQRHMALTLAAMIILQLFINGAAGDWNAGYSYGMRRMTELFPVYVLLACVTYQWLEEKLSHRPSLVYGLRLAYFPLIVYSLIFILAFVSYIWTSPDGWLGKLTPDSVIPYFWEQPHRTEVMNAIFTTHLGPPAWTQPGP